jgi:hypothetical protein
MEPTPRAQAWRDLDFERLCAQHAAALKVHRIRVDMHIPPFFK